MKRILLLILFMVFISCIKSNKDKIIKGEVYIKLIDLGSLYGLSANEVSSFKKTLDSLENTDMGADEEKFVKYYRLLMDKGLLTSPYFKLKIRNDSVINVFTSEDEYLKLKTDLDKLDRDKEKIEVRFKGKEIKEDVYFAGEITSVERKKGKTDWAK